MSSTPQPPYDPNRPPSQGYPQQPYQPYQQPSQEYPQQPYQPYQQGFPPSQGYPQQPYQQPPQGYPQPSTPYYQPSTPMSGFPPVATATMPPRAKIKPAYIILAVVGILVLVLGISGFVRYQGPVNTVKDYMNNLAGHRFSQLNEQLCTPLSSTQLASLNLLSSATIDVSNMSYDLVDESLSDAHVHLKGTMLISYLGQKNSSPIDSVIPVKARGIGWCLDNTVSTTSSGS
jgi:hypothetical protein